MDIIGDGIILYYGFLINDQKEHFIISNKEWTSIWILSLDEDKKIWKESFGPFNFDNGLNIKYVKLVNSISDN